VGSVVEVKAPSMADADGAAQPAGAGSG